MSTAKRKFPSTVSAKPQHVVGWPLGPTQAGGCEQGRSQARVTLLRFKVQGESCRLALSASAIKAEEPKDASSTENGWRDVGNVAE